MATSFATLESLSSSSRVQRIAEYTVEHFLLEKGKPAASLKGETVDVAAMFKALEEKGYKVLSRLANFANTERPLISETLDVEDGESIESLSSRPLPFLDGSVDVDREGMHIFSTASEVTWFRVNENIATRKGERRVSWTLDIAIDQEHTNSEEVKLVLELLKKHRIRLKAVSTKEPKIYILTKSEYGFELTPFSVSVPKTFDLSFYGEGFEEKAKVLTEKLSTDAHGAYLFGGPRGTGKTTFIKYLTGTIDRKFIFLPENIAASMTDPIVQSVLLEHQGAVFVIEDAEKLLAKRTEGNSLVSTILNASDGLMGEAFKASIILTHNSDEEDFDPALKRKGRLKWTHTFDLLKPEIANFVAEKMGVKERFTVPTALCDIVFAAEENYHREKKKAALGFRQMAQPTKD